MSQILKPKQGYKIVTNFFRRETEIPDDWDYPKFNKVVKTNPITKIDEKNVPYIPMNAVDVKKPNFRYFEERILSDNFSLPKFQENDVLFARITPSTENGKTCIIENFNRKGIASSELTVLRSSDKVFPKYLYYYVKRYRIRQFAISQMLGTTGRQRVPDYVFKQDLNFELPSLKEQQKIASILSGVDALMQNTEQIIKGTERLKKGLMQRLLTKGIGHDTFKKVKWYFGKKIEIPEEWISKKVEDVFKLKSGSTPSRTKPEFFDGDISWVTSTDLNRSKITSTIEKITKDAVKDANLAILTKGTFVIATYGLEADGTRGKCGILEMNATCNQACMAFLPPSEMNSLFLFYFYLYFGEKIIFSIAQGTKQQNLYSDTVKKVTLLIPPLNEQQKIASILSGVDALKNIMCYCRCCFTHKIYNTFNTFYNNTIS